MNIKRTVRSRIVMMLIAVGLTWATAAFPPTALIVGILLAINLLVFPHWGLVTAFLEMTLFWFLMISFVSSLRGRRGT